MKKIITLIGCIISFNYAIAQVFPVVDLRVAGRKDNRINLVILPDGYTASEQTKFAGDADSLRIKAFEYQPFKEYRNFYNVYCIKVPSAESGINHPATAADIVETIPKMVVDNYFGSTLDYTGFHRRIEALNTSKIYGVLSANIPEYDQVFVLSNTSLYGGGGGVISTGTTHSSSVYVAVHEWGHSFADLADEYWPGAGTEKINMTTNNDPLTVRWKNWLGVKGIGIHSHLTGYPKEWYRPHQNCAMRYNGDPFCSVCQGAFIDKIYKIVTPIDEVKPDTTSTVSYSSSPLLFTTSLLRPIPNTLVVKWTLNGIAIPFTDTFANITGSMLSSGINELKLIVTDTTGLSRSYWPTAGYQFTKTWKINKTGTGIVNVYVNNETGKFFYRIFPNPATKKIQFEYENFYEETKTNLRIVDNTGRVVKSESLGLLKGKNSLFINIEGINQGVYFITLNSLNVTICDKLIIE